MSVRNKLEDLPKECLIAVLQNVGVRDWTSLACTSKFFHQFVQDDSLWKSLALRKWGSEVETLAAPRVAPGGWKTYCCHRTPSVSMPPSSPLDLIQEHSPDPWSHIACCILCSRTTGGPAVRAAIRHVLSRWTTPSAILHAVDGELTEAINPLGLQLNRIKGLKCMSRDFLEKDWELPSEFHGCGKFVTDSWRIFCRGHRTTRDVDDVNLKRYLQWLNKGEQVEKTKKKRATRAKPAKKAGISGNPIRKRKSAGEIKGDQRATRHRGTTGNSGNIRQTRAASQLLKN